MKKRLVILIGMLAALLVAAVPVLAQGQVTATGVLERSTRESPDPTPRYAITDEESDTSYELFDAGAELEAYVGERVTISGTQAPGPGTPDGPLAVDVTQVTPADDPPGPPPGEDTVTLSFELTVKGTPPAGTRFFGSAVGEGGPGTPLTDPDGDGVFTGSVTVPRFPPGPRPVPPGAEPVSLSVRIVQENGGNLEVIRDFGLVPLEEDRTFEARINFKRDRGDTTTPTPNNGGSGSGGSGGTSEPTSPESGEDVNGDGSIDATDGEVAASVSEAAREATEKTGERTLPVTGGMAPLSLFAASAGLLLVGGLLIRRINHR
ncbi:MAG: hypothetical protein AVDCRST_MAG28-664 [uncultured Rubrobacteraceae bacterium]|uniref:Gram-positive cocci surface proteins LPxTG domain-containing protein n=1 Tax=uncultured Rubrobacteraceae bacterium TaxID=349277 RepID=A0A6J4QIH6_9ACTN|nr:MAG: hypothetical protein AVDCRST_MAG28-664 [uncultured Rubrobacteraceae bacterium]